MSEIKVTLPDGAVLELPRGVTVGEVALQIGPGLAKAAVAGRIDGGLVDLRLPLDRDVALQLVTTRDEAAGEVIRHSTEHVMADAVKRCFPDAQIDVGRTDHSEKYQYDFLVDEPFTPADLERIEKAMGEIIKEKVVFEREVVSRDEARRIFGDLGENLKVLRLDDIPEGEDITLYRHGDFVDLCRGPHVAHAGQIGAFSLLEVSGSYLRGDESGPKLQRIYGTAFASKKDMKAYRKRVEEAKERDHRRVGTELELFYLDPLSPGSPFYLPKGTTVYNGLIDLMRDLYRRHGYQEVVTPQLFRAELFQISGHYEKFHDDMFWFAGADEGEELGIKAMNCPGHCQLFRSTKRSYRELPLRLAEFSRLHRNERSGTLSGLTRVRSMAQDDAHIFCEPEQLGAEIEAFFVLTAEVYRILGLEGVEMAVSTRPEGFLGDAADWDLAERQLQEGVEKAGFDCRIKPGEAAFYAPKVEADFRDVLGRSWTLATLQIDVALPTRFGLAYIGRDGQSHQPAMLHRAVLGSLERFLAIYIEHTGGDFPFWLAPVQVAVLPIAERHVPQAEKIGEKLLHAGIRSRVDARSETLGFKIREMETKKIPLALVVGDREAADGTVTPRLRGGGNEPAGAQDADGLVAMLVEASAKRRPMPFN